MAQLFLAALVATTLIPQIHADDRSEYMVGYRAYKDALIADERGDIAGATAGYREALRIYQTVQATYPDFETTMVDFRIKKLKSRINELEQKLTVIDTARTEGDLLNINMDQQAEIDRLKQETIEKDAELVRLRQALGAAREEAAQSAEASEHRDRLLWENRQHKQTIEALKKQVAELGDAKPGIDAAAAEARIQAEKAERDRLEAEIARLREANDAATLELGAAKKRLSEVTVKDSSDQLRTTEALRSLAQAQEQITRLEQALDKASKSLETTTTELNAVRKTVVDRDQQVAELREALARTEGGEGAADAIVQHAAEMDALRQAQAEAQRAKVEREHVQAELNALQAANTSLRTQLAEVLGGMDHDAATAASPDRVADGVVRQRDTLQIQHNALKERYDALLGVQRNLESQIRVLQKQVVDQTRAYDRLVVQRNKGADDPAGTSVDEETQAYLVRLKRQHKAEIEILNRQVATLLAKMEEANQQLEKRRQEEPEPGTESDFENLPERVQILLRRAVEAEASGNNQTAVHFYEQVLRIVPNDPMALSRLGNLALDTGDLDVAEEKLSRAFYLSPDDRDVLLPLGAVYIRKSQYDMAVSLLARAAALYAEDPEVHRNFGVAAARIGWPDVAEREFLRAVELDRTDAKSAFNLAILYATQEPPAINEARKWYTTAKELGATPDPAMDQLLDR